MHIYVSHTMVNLLQNRCTDIAVAMGNLILI